MEHLCCLLPARQNFAFNRYGDSRGGGVLFSPSADLISDAPSVSPSSRRYRAMGRRICLHLRSVTALRPCCISFSLLLCLGWHSRESYNPARDCVSVQILREAEPRLCPATLV